MNKSTADEIEKSEAQTISLGLMQYVAHTPAASSLFVKFNSPTVSQTDDEARDKWHHWLFSIGAYGNASGEKSATNVSVTSSVSADHVTEQWKINLSANYGYTYNRYSYDTYNFENKTYSKSASALAVKSLSDHWSAGFSSDVYHSEYGNYKLSANFCPTVEYDVFPYDASATHLITFKYRTEPTINQYIDTTIYNKTQEFYLGNTLSAKFKLKEKWGSLSSNISASAILEDPNKHSLSISNSISWNVAQGLSLSLYGSFEIIHDQINLPKHGASQEEILLQLHEMQTNFRYFSYSNLTYSFGSIFNNIVNRNIYYIRNKFNFFDLVNAKIGNKIGAKK